MAPQPPIDLLSTCIIYNMPGNDGFVQGKKESKANTTFEAKTHSRSDRLFSTVGFGIVSTMYNPAALITAKFSEMKDPRPIIETERTDTAYRYTATPSTVNQPTAYRLPVNQPTVNQPTVHQPTVHQPTANQPTVHQPTVNQPTVNQPTVNQPTVNRPTVNRPTANQPTVNQHTVNQHTVNRLTVHQPTDNRSTVNQSTVNQPTVNQFTTKQTTIYLSTVPQSTIPTILFPTMHQQPTTTAILLKFFPHFSHPPYHHLLHYQSTNSAVGA